MTDLVKRGTRPTIAQLILPFWLHGENRIFAWGLLAVILSIMFGGIYLSLWANRLTGQLIDVMVARDWAQIKPLMLLSFTVGMGAVFLPILNFVLQQLIQVKWRTWMTAYYLERWLGDHAYYGIERDGLINNADQRIADDINYFVDSTLNLSLNALSAVVSSVSFSVVLWQLSGVLEFDLLGIPLALPGYLVFAVCLYSIVNLALVHYVGKPLIGLNNHRQTVEANFRYLGMQVRENAEQIAFYEGGAREAERLREAFGGLLGNWYQIIVRTSKVMFTRALYNHTFSVLPTLLVLPRYLAGTLSFGDIGRTTGAFAAVENSLAFFSQAYENFTHWLAVVNRLRDMDWAVSRAGQPAQHLHSERNPEASLECVDLQLRDPFGRHLTDIARWSVQPGERWLISGASGTGKSTLLRVCAGLWPYAQGSVRRPASSCFLPQRSYIPSGTLKAALCYPFSPGDFADDACRRVLTDACLENLCEQLGVNARWQQKLSGGEQQRLALARVMLQRPTFVFLDEATSALDPQTEQRLYRALLGQLPDSAIVSVAHRIELKAFHEHSLELLPAT